MLNTLTLRESIKQISINLKQHLDGVLFPCFSSNSQLKCTKWYLLKSIKHFSINTLKKNIIFHIGKLENTGEEEIKEKKQIVALITLYR